MGDQEDGNKEPDRGLDSAPTSSMDIQSLNNFIVSLRGLMKRVQLFTIQKLVRQSKQLRSKKGTEENQKKKKKAERLVQEVGSVKDVKIDHAIKYALGNTKTFEEIAGKGDLDTRAKVRLATHPLMMDKVKSWRDQYEDWKALAAFVLYKNTGRRYKKKKKKDNDDKSAEESTSTEKSAKLNKTTKTKEEEGKESTPSKRKLVVPKIGDGESAKVLARRAKTARNRQNHDETEKVEDNDTSKSTDPSEAAVPPTITRPKSGTNDAEHEEDNSSVSSKEDNSSMETEEKMDDEEDESSGETNGKVDDEADDSSEEDEVSETEEKEHREEDFKSDKKDADDSENESSEEESDSGESDNEESDEDEEDTKIETKSSKPTETSSKEVTKSVKLKLKPKIETKSTKQTEASSKEETKPVKLKPKPKPIGYKAGKEMAIRKIDLATLSEDVEDIPVEADVAFLFTASKADDIPKPKPKKKDAFFAMDSGEEEDEEDKEETTKKQVKGQREKINYDNDVGTQRKQHHKKIESAFVGRLSDKQAKGDWGYGKGSFSRPPPVEQGPWGRGGGSSSGGRGRAGFNQGVQRDQREGDYSGSTGSGGPQAQRDQPANTMDHGAQDGKLHPSWEAKRKRKELESKIAEFKGKKIKFDD